MTDSAFTRLLGALDRGPVMVEITQLMMLCLPPDVEILPDAEELVEHLDGATPHSEKPTLIPRVDSRYEHRFQVFRESIPFQPISVNQMLADRLADARRWLLTHRSVADRIASDTIHRGYRAIALLLVDGLGYDDARLWPEAPEPCLIDGPSVTYSAAEDGTVVPTVGFPGIVGIPPLARRLLDVGIRRSFGFSYWSRERNEVSAHLFEGMPLRRVTSINEALDTISQLPLEGTYVQLLREGLDGLAHSRREVTEREIGATVDAIHEDLRRLVGILAATGLPSAIYLTADHGILWKALHPDLGLGEGLRSSHPRYQRDGNPPPDLSVAFCLSGQTYSLYRYPYLGAAIRANDSGVHGGLSYWESFVPFVRVEVNL